MDLTNILCTRNHEGDLATFRAILHQSYCFASPPIKYFHTCYLVNSFQGSEKNQFKVKHTTKSHRFVCLPQFVQHKHQGYQFGSQYKNSDRVCVDLQESEHG